ncbi:MAG: hypothetical protein AAF503_01265, partial [Pseudomonadota bacterium]
PGCATYLQEKADLQAGGGQSQRLIAAKERQENAKAEQLSLQEEQIMANEELSALQDELQTVNRSETVRQSQIEKARSNTNISQQKLEALSKQLKRQTEAFNDEALALEATRSVSSDAQVAAKEAELKALKKELNETNRQIDILIQ